jgi:uncharacterized membrane protein
MLYLEAASRDFSFVDRAALFLHTHVVFPFVTRFATMTKFLILDSFNIADDIESEADPLLLELHSGKKSGKKLPTPKK